MLGQLMCVLCKTIVKSEVVWFVHLNSKLHKENIALAKKTRLEPETVPKTNEPSLKRQIPSVTEDQPNKKVKGILKNVNQTQEPTQISLPPDFFDKPPTLAIVIGSKSTTAVSLKKSEKQNSNDELESKKIDNENEKLKKKEANQPPLPEGFFDDPILDAKVRNVEYKDPIEEEWEKFQKEIKEETAQSAQIIADDQEEATTERQIDEIEEQIRHWSRVMDLVRWKEQVQAAEKKKESVDENVSSGDESEFDEFLDWRAKNSY
ncbi:zinc finger protein 830 isoform X2 [Orussus abietinus]|uniref:zinc finger protein 830 isoform X2 n=1 Tax=Orussus abietinus TaxID=222816 RepID=UPI000625F07A|nr:zinc finger protein 830 isoform X2 [Orussus abietinus]